MRKEILKSIASNNAAINKAAEGITLHLCVNEEMDEATEEAWDSLTEEERDYLLSREISVNSENEEWLKNVSDEEYDKEWEEMKDEVAEMLKTRQKNDFLKNHITF